MATDWTQAARDWLAQDPDPETRDELRALLDAAQRHPAAGPGDNGDGGAEGEKAAAELADRFRGSLRFGTAGLRGELGAGPNRMNRAVVIRAAAGLVAYLKQQGRTGGPVVIGYDARHKSAEFARDTAAVVVGAGLRAALLPRPLPTPVLAFAVRHLGAVAGVTVTASHNPPRDNGYKVFLGWESPVGAPPGRRLGEESGGGAQIAPPADAEIAAEIDAIDKLADVPLADGGWEVLDTSDEALLHAYLERAVGVLTPGSPRDASVVYTPLHGVGKDVLAAAFLRAGFPAPTVVPEQAEPDPDFPTVAFPNPEEPGAMDLAFRTAAEAAPDVVIANDPDADRCAVAVPDSAAAGGWRMLRGDEVGALLATHLVSKRAQGTFATTIVSSSLLSRIAGAAGLPYAETLTGFKWLSRADGLRYGYEEALGYCVDPEGVRDKDGISAALLVAELVATLKQSGRTLTDLLDDIALEYGLHATDQLSVRVDNLSTIARAMQRLRERPPAVLAGMRVAAADDLAKGESGLPPTDGLRYRLAPAEDGPAVESARIVVRPSGTEPKLKCYLEVVVPVPNARALAPARTTAAGLLAALKQDLSSAAGI